MQTAKINLLVADDLDTSSAQDSARGRSLRAHSGFLAKRLGAEIDLVHIEDPLSNLRPPEQEVKIAGQSISKSSAQLELTTKSYPVKVHTEIRLGAPAEELIRLSGKLPRHEMIALGTHGRSGIKRLLLGSVAEELVRNSRIPVLTIGAHVQKGIPETTPSRPLKILIATDLLTNSRKAEHYGVSLAKRLGAEVELFYCLNSRQQLSYLADSPGIVGSTQDKNWVDEAKTDCWRLLNIREKSLKRQGVKVHSNLDDTHVNAAQAILVEIKRYEPHYVVMGTHGRSKLATAFLGSTARELISESPVPVITVRSRG